MQKGAVVIETAVAVPLLATLAVGSFDVSKIVTRQIELQSCSEHAQEIALSSNWGGHNDVNLIASILADSFSLRDDQIEVEKIYRCEAAEAFTLDETTCGEEASVSTYVRITLTDTYTPLWTKFGVGSPHTFRWCAWFGSHDSRFGPAVWYRYPRRGSTRVRHARTSGYRDVAGRISDRPSRQQL